MTNQDKIKYLKRYKRLKKEVDRSIEELRYWRELADVASPKYSDMPKSTKTGNPIEDAVINAADVCKDLRRDIRELCRLRRRIERAIANVQDNTLRLLLQYRYIDCKKWEQIAIDMDYDYRWVLRLHGRAIDQINTP